MDATDWKTLLSKKRYTWGPAGPGATDAELADLARWFGRPLPEDYAAFLRLNNGATVHYHGQWELAVYSTAEAPDAARGYGFTRPELEGGIVFGTDLSDTGLLFDVRPQHPDGRYPVYGLDYIDVSDGWASAFLIAGDFRHLLTRRKPLRTWPQFTRGSFSSHAACIANPLLCPYCGARISPWTFI